MEVGLITSQIDTAPKHNAFVQAINGGLITSQIDTAPKPRIGHPPSEFRLITSQIDTAPKRKSLTVTLCCV